MYRELADKSIVLPSYVELREPVRQAPFFFLLVLFTINNCDCIPVVSTIC